MDWGNFHADGDSLTLADASGETSTLSVANDALIRGEATLSKVEPLPDGTKVDCSLSTFFYSGFSPGGGLDGGMTLSSYTVFNPDGTWQQDRSGGASAGFVDGGGTTTGAVTTTSKADDAGRNEVKDGLMTLTPNEGSAPQTALILRSGADIMIGDLTLASGAEK